jgi:hypothetical protein
VPEKGVFAREGIFAIEQQGRHPAGVAPVNAPGNPDEGLKRLFSNNLPDFNVVPGAVVHGVMAMS